MAELEQDALRYRAVRSAIAAGLQIVATDEKNHIVESFVGWDNSHDPPAHLDRWADLLIARATRDKAAVEAPR